MEKSKFTNRFEELADLYSTNTYSKPDLSIFGKQIKSYAKATEEALLPTKIVLLDENGKELSVRILEANEDPEFQYGFSRLFGFLFPLNQIERHVDPVTNDITYFEHKNPIIDYPELKGSEIKRMFYQLSAYFVDADKIDSLANLGDELKAKSSENKSFEFKQKKTRKKSQKQNGNFHFKDFGSIRKNLNSLKNPSKDEFKSLFKNRLSRFFYGSISYRNDENFFDFMYNLFRDNDIFVKIFKSSDNDIYQSVQVIFNAYWKRYNIDKNDNHIISFTNLLKSFSFIDFRDEYESIDASLIDELLSNRKGLRLYSRRESYNNPTELAERFNLLFRSKSFEQVLKEKGLDHLSTDVKHDLADITLIAMEKIKKDMLSIESFKHKTTLLEETVIKDRHEEREKLMKDLLGSNLDNYVKFLEKKIKEKTGKVTPLQSKLIQKVLYEKMGSIENPNVRPWLASNFLSILNAYSCDFLGIGSKAIDKKELQHIGLLHIGKNDWANAERHWQWFIWVDIASQYVVNSIFDEKYGFLDTRENRAQATQVVQIMQESFVDFVNKKHVEWERNLLSKEKHKQKEIKLRFGWGIDLILNTKENYIKLQNLRKIRAEKNEPTKIEKLERELKNIVSTELPTFFRDLYDGEVMEAVEKLIHGRVMSDEDIEHEIRIKNMAGSTWDFYFDHWFDRIDVDGLDADPKKLDKYKDLKKLKSCLAAVSPYTQVVNDLSDYFDIINGAPNKKAFADWLGALNYPLKIAFDSIPGFEEKWMPLLGHSLSPDQKGDLRNTLAVTKSDELNGQSVVEFLLAKAEMLAIEAENIIQSMIEKSSSNKYLVADLKKLKNYVYEQFKSNRIINEWKIRYSI
jgi:hypothetical protein